MKTLTIALVILIILLIIAVVYGIRAHISINRLTKAWATAEKERLEAERNLNAFNHVEFGKDIIEPMRLNFIIGIDDNVSEDDRFSHMINTISTPLAYQIMSNSNLHKIEYRTTSIRKEALVEITILPYKEDE